MKKVEFLLIKGYDDDGTIRPKDWETYITEIKDSKVTLSIFSEITKAHPGRMTTEYSYGETPDWESLDMESYTAKLVEEGWRVLQGEPCIVDFPNDPDVSPLIMKKYVFMKYL